MSVTVSNGGDVLTKGATTGSACDDVFLDLSEDISIEVDSWTIRLAYNRTFSDAAAANATLQIMESSMENVFNDAFFDFGSDAPIHAYDSLQVSNLTSTSDWADSSAVKTSVILAGISLIVANIM